CSALKIVGRVVAAVADDAPNVNAGAAMATTAASPMTSLLTVISPFWWTGRASNPYRHTQSLVKPRFLADGSDPHLTSGAHELSVKVAPCRSTADLQGIWKFRSESAVIMRLRASGRTRGLGDDG